MATTAKGTPYVESSDLVANYPAVSLALAEHIDDFGGKVLQVVRATDTTNRTTTSGSFVDASISVTITPQKSDSLIIIFWLARVQIAANSFTLLRIADNSNNALSGAEEAGLGGMSTISSASLSVIGYSTPATTSATLYKGRFFTTSGTGAISNNQQTGQMYAIEVSA